MIAKRINILIFTLTLASSAFAQTVKFSGVGRALFSVEDMVDESNQESELKASGGYTIMDLGVIAEPDEVLRANIILRQRNEFGGFFDNGTSLEFRQMQLEGLIAKRVKYEVGDVYMQHTPYTIWNSETIFNDYESDLFALRRGIAYYENFFVDNKWRMQGVNTKAKLVDFEKGLESIELRVYGGRTRPTDFNTIPDRYYYGGKLDLVQSDMLRVAGNLSGISDIAGTVGEASVDYDNMVYTGDFELKYDKLEKVKLRLLGEAGGSYFKLAREADTVASDFSDFFFDAGVEAKYVPLNLTFNASYRDVGYDFNSPMAQTRRIGNPSNIDITYFPTLNDDATARSYTLYDSYAQESGLYNQSMSTTLMNYFIKYDMVEPYGRATPNRKGLTLSAKMEHPKEILDASFEANFLGEVVSEGDSLTQATRNFSLMRGGLDFNIDKLLGWEKAVVVSGGVRAEKSSRDGTNAIELSSCLIDLSLDVEVIANLRLLGGAKMFSVSGTEMTSGRDELNQITAFTPVTYNESQTMYAVGLRYDYDKKAYFSMQGTMVDFEDELNSTTSFDLNQWFFVFGLKF